MVEYEDKIKYMELVNKTKDSIELTFGKINANIKVCDLIGMTRSMVRITDNARALKEQNGITSNEYLNYISRIDEMIIKASICKCKKIKG